MLQSMEQVIQAIQRGSLREHTFQNVELKEDWSQKYGEKLSALANKITLPVCWLAVGVKNDGQLAGKDEKWAIQREEVISQHINENLDPVQACMGIKCLNIGGSWVIIIQVKSPGEVVYWGKNAFKASGTTLSAMDSNEILQLRIALPGLTDFSRQIVTAGYDVQLAETFLGVLKRKGHPIEVGESPSDTLEKLGIQNKQVCRILFGGCPYRIVYYDCASEPISNVKYYGLYRLLANSFTQELQNWTSNHVQCVPQPYPERALKEALANTVAHSAYFEKDGDIILEVHPDHICVSNLCVRESTYFANRWFSRSHKTINPLLMEVLRIVGHVDELGRGKNLIFSESIKNGKHPPNVVVERAGKYDRWKLFLYGGTTDVLQIRLLERTKQVYKDEQKALIAYALVLWRNKPVSEIRNYIDGDFSRQFAEVLASLDGPILYYEAEDRIILTRWASVLLGEGQDSKGLSPAEEDRLKSLAYDLSTKYESGYITPKRLRELAQMGHTKSEKVLSSNLLKRWEKEGLVNKIKKGQYHFQKKPGTEKINFEDILKRLLDK